MGALEENIDRFYGCNRAVNWQNRKYPSCQRMVGKAGLPFDSRVAGVAVTCELQLRQNQSKLIGSLITKSTQN